MNRICVLAFVMSAIVLGLGPAAGSVAAEESKSENSAATGPPEWRLGVQAFSFYRLTLYETIDKVQSLGLKCIEIIPFQRLSDDKPKVRTNPSMSAEDLAELKAKLKEAGMQVISYGVADLPNDEVECRKVFEFAKALNCGFITSEPPYEALELVDMLCGEYGIDVAIHNHPSPSLYWDPEKVAEACEGRSKRIGACADTSHWMRSGIDPLEALRKLEGRIITLHFGDVSQADIDNLRKLRDEGDAKSMMQAINKVPNVVWGTGAGDMKAWLTELRRQGVDDTVFSIESFFELDPDLAAEKMAECIEYFEKIVAE